MLTKDQKKSRFDISMSRLDVDLIASVPEFIFIILVFPSIYYPCDNDPEEFMRQVVTQGENLVHHFVRADVLRSCQRIKGHVERSQFI